MSILLCLCMVAALMSTAVWADGSSDEEIPEGGITYIGTSVSSGFFLEQDQDDWSEEDWSVIEDEWVSKLNGEGKPVRMGFRPFNAAVPGAVTRLLLEKLSVPVENNRSPYFHNMCHTGMRTAEALRFLSGKGSDFDQKMSEDWLSEAYMSGHYSDFEEDDVQYIYEHCQEWVEKSDLIIVELGSNDTMVTVIDNLFHEKGYLARYSRALNTEELYESLMKIALSGGGLSGVLVKALDAAKTAGELPLMMTAMTRALLDGVTMFASNYKKIIARIYQLNPDAKVLALGTFNPLNHIDLSDSLGISAGGLLDSGIKLMNLQIKTLAPYAISRKYDYTYVDIYNVGDLLQGIPYNLIELLQSGVLEDFTAYKTGPIHPNKYGHVYMCSQIMKALGNYELNIR